MKKSVTPLHEMSPQDSPEELHKALEKATRRLYAASLALYKAALAAGSGENVDLQTPRDEVAKASIAWATAMQAYKAGTGQAEDDADKSGEKESDQ